MSHPPLTGVLPVLQTPFNLDQSIDHGALRHEAQWVLEQGVNGLVIGMVSEVLRLSDDERVAVTLTLSDVAASAGVVLVASVGSESTHHACDRARSAARAGATALMATPPAVLAADDDGLRSYFTSIAEAADLPLVIQDASGYVGAPLSTDLQRQLHYDLGDRALFKPEAHPIGQRLSELRDATAGQARILEGTGGVALVDSFRRGIAGTMPAADVCWAIVALWQALQSGDGETAERISGPLASLISLQASLGAFVAIEKHLLHRQGVLTNTTAREPLDYRLDPETAREAERLTDVLSAACRPEGHGMPRLGDRAASTAI